MMIATLNDISDRLRGDEPVSDAEFSYLVQQAQEAKLSPDDAVSAVLALGFTGDPRYRRILEKYLYYTEDTLVPEYALNSLCRMGFALTYKDYILEAGRNGFDWDHYKDITPCALHNAGRYLAEHRDKDFAGMLFEIIDRNAGKDELDLEIREMLKSHGARMAACLAMGADAETLLNAEDEDEQEAYAAQFLPRFLAERRNG
jgi:hypothetical protein